MRRDHLPGQLGMFSTAEALKPAKLSGGWPQPPAGDLVLQHPPDGKEHAPPQQIGAAFDVPGDWWNALTVEQRAGVLRDFRMHSAYRTAEWHQLPEAPRLRIEEQYWALVHGDEPQQAEPEPEPRLPEIPHEPAAVLVGRRTYSRQSAGPHESRTISGKQLDAIAAQSAGHTIAEQGRVPALFPLRGRAWACVGASYQYGTTQSARLVECIPLAQWTGPSYTYQERSRGPIRGDDFYTGIRVTHRHGTGRLSKNRGEYVIGPGRLELHRAPEQQQRAPLLAGPACDTCAYRAEDDAGELCGLRCEDLPEARTCDDHCPAEEVSDAPEAQT